MITLLLVVVVVVGLAQAHCSTKLDAVVARAGSLLEPDLVLLLELLI